MKQSILFGNGVNLLTDGMPSWNDLIESISKIEIEGNIPNPIKYEAILLHDYKNSNWGMSNTNISKESSIIESTKKMQEWQLKEVIAKELGLFVSNDIIRKISKMPFNHFMTTNYDKALYNEFDKRYIEPENISEKYYSIRRSYKIKNSEVDSLYRYYWPIHGFIDNPPCIMLGYDHYCGSLGKINTYIKGNYEYEDTSLPSIADRLKDESYKVYSWIDLFFTTDIHIIGLGLDYEEIDLWWILNRRKRIMSDLPKEVKNKIYYYQTSLKDKEKELIFKIFDVEFVPLKDESLLFKEDNYPLRYNMQLEEIKNRMDERKNK